MIWSKLKNLILVLLLITNLFLVALVLSQEAKLDSQEQEARQLALNFLTQRGISIDYSIVPEEISLMPQELKWNRQTESQHATALLKSKGTVLQESLGGDIVRYYNDAGEIRFHDNGEFYATFSPDLFIAPNDQLGKFALDLLERLGFQGQILKEESTSQGETLVTVEQMHNGIPLLGCEVMLRFSEQSLLEVVHGKRLEGDYTLVPEKNITVATALVQCYNQLQALGHSNQIITEIHPCYMVSTPLSSDPSLTPGWNVITNTGSFFLNTLDGSFTQLSS